MSIAVAELRDLLDVYSYCPLECDGLTRVLTTLLQRQNIAHTVYTGTVAHRVSSACIVHMWIEVCTDEGRRVIDYRAQQWLLQYPQVGSRDKQRSPGDVLQDAMSTTSSKASIGLDERVPHGTF